MSPSIRRPFMGSAFSPTTAWIKSLETTGGVGVGKEEGGIFVEFRRRAPEHLTQVGGKVFIPNRSRQDILARLAQVVDGGEVHGGAGYRSVVQLSGGSFWEKCSARH